MVGKYALGLCVNARGITLTQRLSIKIFPTSLSERSSVLRYFHVRSVEFHRAVPIPPSLLRACCVILLFYNRTVHRCIHAIVLGNNWNMQILYGIYMYICKSAISVTCTFYMQLCNYI